MNGFVYMYAAVYSIIQCSSRTPGAASSPCFSPSHSGLKRSLLVVRRSRRQRGPKNGITIQMGQYGRLEGRSGRLKLAASKSPVPFPSHACSSLSAADCHRPRRRLAFSDPSLSPARGPVSPLSRRASSPETCAGRHCCPFPNTPPSSQRTVQTLDARQTRRRHNRPPGWG
ncbi:hypothetical protein C2E23DRAFT_223093 [Lenzites betulinus]|nr:hypothetical protein C2E23DRAFT_223093 [Lenzites betulinus]